MLFELSLQDAQHFVHRFFFEVGILDDHLTLSSEHTLSGLEANLLELVDNPGLDSVGELVEAYVAVVLHVVKFTEDIDGITYEHAGQFDVQAALTDSE